jgi:transcription termination/antitermination protein NusG
VSSLQQLGRTPSAMLPLAPLFEPTYWYAVQTRARHEKKVAKQLQEQGATTFLPLVTQTHRWSDRSKVIELPLFPCYAFARLVHSVEMRLPVLQTPGVLSIVGAHGVGAPIPDKEIEDIQTLFAQNVSSSLYPFIKVGQRVRIRGGCLDGVEGILVAEKSDRRLVVSIELIQQSVSVQIAGYGVEAI